MQQTPDPLGSCTECGARLFDAHVLVEYEAEGQSRYYAECPDCQTVVHPA